MSLHKFAEQVAQHGRGDDSLLVHMTPDEVRNLQRFAQANGTTLTINPTTGLPEAGLLSDLFKAVAPIALGAFLGPAGLGMSSMMAGVATGGITTLATGSLSRGLMAGLGAYGGAGLGSSLMGASGMTGGAALGAGMPADIGFNLADAGVTDAGMQTLGNVDTASKAIAQAQPTAFDKIAAGAKAVTASPGAAMDFAKGNLGNLAYAAAPIAAGLMVPTTTKLGDPKDTGYIRQFDYNINPDTGRPDPLYGMRAMTPVKASEFGNKTFQGQRELFRQQNPNPYDIGIGSLNQPPQQQTTPMASGGIVALAEGGDVIRMAAGTPPAILSDEALYQKTGSWEAAAAARDAQNNALNAFNNQQAADARDQAARASNIMADADRLRGALNINTSAPTPVPTGSAGLQFATARNQTPDQYYGTVANQFNELTGFGDKYANATDAQIDAATRDAATKFGVSQADIMTALEKGGGSTALRYAIGAGDMGLSGLNTNINAYLAKAQTDPAFKAMTAEQQQQAARDAMSTVNMNEADVIRATGKTIAELFPKTVIKPPISVIPTGFYGNDTGNPLTRTPGDITTNPDGSVTVHPNIPGRPDGGFTGMGQVKDAYTAGGGSLGYTAPVPKTAAEHNAMYNKLTDDSLDAYNFLMGKGKNLTQRKAETRDRPVMQRYDEAVLGRKMTRPVKTTATTKSVTGVPGQPQTYFNEAEYLAANPDVAAELKSGKSNFTTAYEHYLRYGKAEGRKFAGDYEGYTTALALAAAAGAGGGGDGPTGPSGGGNPNSISGFTPAPPNDSIPDTTMGPSAASPPGETGESVSGDYNSGGLLPRGYAMGGGLGSLGSYSDGGRLLRGPGDGVSDSIPATIGRKQQPARLADGEFVIPARIVSELGNGSTDAGAKKLYAMMDRVQRARGKTTGRNKVAANSRADKYLPA